MKPTEGSAADARVGSDSGATSGVDVVAGEGEGEGAAGKGVGEGGDLGAGSGAGAGGNLFPLKDLGPNLPVPPKTDVLMEEPGSSGPWVEP